QASLSTTITNCSSTGTRSRNTWPETRVLEDAGHWLLCRRESTFLVLSRTKIGRPLSMSIRIAAHPFRLPRLSPASQLAQNSSDPLLDQLDDALPPEDVVEQTDRQQFTDECAGERDLLGREGGEQHVLVEHPVESRRERFGEQLQRRLQPHRDGSLE